MPNNFLSQIMPFMSTNKLQPNRPMRIAYWITKAPNTHTEYVQLITFPLQQLLHERASILRYTNIVDLFWGVWGWGQSKLCLKQLWIFRFCTSMTSAARRTRISYRHDCLAQDGYMRKSTKS